MKMRKNRKNDKMELQRKKEELFNKKWFEWGVNTESGESRVQFLTSTLKISSLAFTSISRQASRLEGHG